MLINKLSTKKKFNKLKRIILEFGTFNIKIKGKKCNYYTSVALLTNVILVITKIRKACLPVLDDIKKTTIKHIDKIADEFHEDGLKVLYKEYKKYNKNHFQIIFYNTNLISTKIIKSALDSYNPKSKDKIDCYCDPCQGSKKFISKMQHILNYPSEYFNIDYKNDHSYYLITFWSEYKTQQIAIIHYRSKTKPNKKDLENKYKKIMKIYLVVNLKLKIELEHHSLHFIDEKSIKN